MAETTERSDGAFENRARLREGLLDQLRHLVREVDMLENVIGRVPEKLLVEAPPGETHSIKEIFGLIARLDEAVHPERIERLLAEDTPHFAPADPEALLSEEAWGEQPITAILERVRTARQGLVHQMEAVPPNDWLRTGVFPKDEAKVNRTGENDEEEAEERDLYWMAHTLCQRDAARLKGMTRRLHESHMGAPPEEREGQTKRSGEASTQRPA